MYLLDTNVVSEATKKRPDSGVVEFLCLQSPNQLFLSALTIGEVEWGIENVADAAKRAALRQWLSHDLLPAYAGRILPIDRRRHADLGANGVGQRQKTQATALHGRAAGCHSAAPQPDAGDPQYRRLSGVRRGADQPLAHFTIAALGHTRTTQQTVQAS